MTARKKVASKDKVSRGSRVKRAPAATTMRPAQDGTTRKPKAATGSGHVILRTPTREIPLLADVNLARAAMEWTYIVRSRSRWSGMADSTKKQSDHAARFLHACGVDDAGLGALADAGIVEVAIPWDGSESNGWAARILPWEFLIGGATRSLRNQRPLTVGRRLVSKQHATVNPAPNPKVLFVSAAPRPLDHEFDFETERDLVRARVAGNSDARWRELTSPTRTELRDAVASYRPDVLHITGFDNHLALRVLTERNPAAAKDFALRARGMSDEGEVLDGLVLRGDAGGLDPVDAASLASLLTANHRPSLVLLGNWNSAARMAPLVVAAGAHAAVGFQDTFDDDLAELFYSQLYSTWVRSGSDLVNAFRSAWESVRSAGVAVQGTGVVLWTGAPLFPASAQQSADASDRKRDSLAKRLSDEENEVIDAKLVKSSEVDSWIAVNVKPITDFNYSLIHNGQPLFEHFSLTVKRPKTLSDVEIRVSLSVGGETASFERVMDITTKTKDLKEDIHVPLTSALTRSVHESVRTSLFVDIRWGGHILFRDSFRLRLVPVDQWRDTPSDRIWLPSFIFPRDPAVTKLITTAQRYVQVLRDDPSAGFDGYQSFDPNTPSSAGEIDLQVQAIWSAMIHELDLAYINPPPGYSRDLDSQRLRSPSMVTRERNGTCIDLALFFAACCELVDIYPVVFLLTGHAFPGYWRSDSDHDAFCQALPEAIEEIAPADARSSAATLSQPRPWFLGRGTYKELVEHVRKGRLVPLETVRLTEHCGFWEAVAAGRENLKDADEFDSMIDIVLARTSQVTPLPLWGEQS